MKERLPIRMPDGTDSSPKTTLVSISAGKITLNILKNILRLRVDKNTSIIHTKTVFAYNQ
jgi:hypothetical protein